MAVRPCVVAAYAGEKSMAGFAVRLVALSRAGFAGESSKFNDLWFLSPVVCVRFSRLSASVISPVVFTKSS